MSLSLSILIRSPVYGKNWIFLQSHCWKDPDDAKAYRSILSKEQIYDFLVGLTPSLDDVCGRILGFKPLPCLDDIFEEVC